MAWETTYTCFPWPYLQDTNSRHLKIDLTYTLNAEKLPELLELYLICYNICNQLDCFSAWRKLLGQFCTTIRIHNGPVSVQRFWGLEVCIEKQKIEKRDWQASYEENDSTLRNLFVTSCRKKWWLRFWLPCFIWNRSLLKAHIKRIFVLWNLILLFNVSFACFLVIRLWVHDNL